jgi:DNA/RNA endonuclease YhcR with UshA esterase domain
VATIAVLLLILGGNFHRPVNVQGAALYNPAEEVTVKGVVQEVQEFDCPVSEGEIGSHLMLKTSDGVLQVHLAPVRIMTSQKLTFTPGEQLEVVGAKVRLAGQKGLIAREITRGNESIIFRDGQGRLLLVQ